MRGLAGLGLIDLVVGRDHQLIIIYRVVRRRWRRSCVGAISVVSGSAIIAAVFRKEICLLRWRWIATYFWHFLNIVCVSIQGWMAESYCETVVTPNFQRRRLMDRGSLGQYLNVTKNTINCVPSAKYSGSVRFICASFSTTFCRVFAGADPICSCQNRDYLRTYSS